MTVLHRHHHHHHGAAASLHPKALPFPDWPIAHGAFVVTWHEQLFAALCLIAVLLTLGWKAVRGGSRQPTAQSRPQRYSN